MNMRVAAAVFLAAILVAAPSLALGNLIRNPSFEDAAPSSSRHALYWKIHEPDAHGDAYGSTSREDWRSRDGMYVMTIRGSWAGAGDMGGIWQEAAAEAGGTYRASVWLWADPDWTPQVQELKLEFWPEDYANPLATISTPLRDLPPDWTRHEVTATAPEGTAWVRLIIHVERSGDHGALQIDSVYLSLEADYDEPDPEPIDVIIDIVGE